MKKVISLLLVAVMLTGTVSVFASEGTKFIKYTGNQALTEDGRLYSITDDGLELLDTDVVDFTYSAYIKKDAYIDYYDIRLRSTSFKEDDEADYYAVLKGEVVQDTEGNIFRRYTYNSAYDKELLEHNTNGTKIIKSSDYFFLAEDNTLYKGSFSYDGDLFGITKFADNVKDFKDGYSGDVFCYYRDINDNLYYYKSGQDITLFLPNCSKNYSDEGFAKTNDGKWYHWGENAGYELEPEKLVDGNNITPSEIKAPMLATSYVCKREYDNKDILWALDGSLHYGGKKVADNVVDTLSYDTYITGDGDIVEILDKWLYDVEYKVHDTNFVEMESNGFGYTGIDSKGTLVILDDESVKKVYANHKYLNRSDWADAEIAQADKIGYIDSVKLFDMQSNISREDFCNMIVDFCEKYLGRGLSTTANPFEDTENEKVIKAYANGIITGISSDEFAPDDKITREQMCAIMTRAAKFLKPDVQFGKGIKFNDMHTVSDWAVEGVNAMSGLGIVKGDGYSITPQTNTSVEQAIAMTYRLYNKIK